jgi:hypothetical protein
MGSSSDAEGKGCARSINLSLTNIFAQGVDRERGF